MYFVHSFYVEPEDEAVILSTSVYGNQQYCSSIKKENIFATQFHPEKSGHIGLEIYRSFKNHLSINV
jgi:glutamine amidotransferase